MIIEWFSFGIGGMAGLVVGCVCGMIVVGRFMSKRLGEISDFMRKHTSEVYAE